MPAADLTGMWRSGPLSSHEQGFTLIKLLVVVLILGVLAAVAVPLFAAQRANAGDAPAKEMLHTAQITAETFALDVGGYATVSPSLLHKFEPTITTTKAGTDAWLSAAKDTATSYTLTVTSSGTGNRLTLVRKSNGIDTRSCIVPRTTSTYGGCENVHGTTGTW